MCGEGDWSPEGSWGGGGEHTYRGRSVWRGTAWPPGREAEQRGGPARLLCGVLGQVLNWTWSWGVGLELGGQEGDTPTC